LSSSAERLMCADAFGRGRSEASSRDNSGCVAEASRPVRADSEASPVSQRARYLDPLDRVRRQCGPRVPRWRR
jgi:hypothetical protein